jgi:hypothetical protein
MHKFQDILFKSLHKVLLGRASRRTLVGRGRRIAAAEKGRFTKKDVRRILERTWRIFDRLSPEIPREPTVGAKHNVRFACLALCLLNALAEEGVEREYARILISDILWQTYKIGASVPLLIARLLTRDPKRRVRLCAQLFMAFPFNRPGYQYEILPDDSPENAIAVKWTRCPKINYLKTHQAEDLCLECLCNLDYPLLEYWGGQFERPCTQAEGAAFCHMRFNIPNEQQARKSGAL